MVRFKNGILACSVVVATWVTTAMPATAGVITVDAIDAGWYEDTGWHQSDLENYFMGETGEEKRNWFAFDLSSVADGIVSAELRIQNGPFGYLSDDPTETIEFYDVSTPVSTLRADHDISPPDPNVEGQGIFDDLGTGELFASRTVSAADNGTIVSILLNSAAIESLNDANSLWAIGGRLATIDDPGSPEAFFSGSLTSPTRQLVLTTSSSSAVPEPSSIALFGMGLVGIAMAARRRQKRPVSV